MNKQCDCKLCEHSRWVDAVVDTRDVDKLIELVRDMQDDACNMGHDNDYMTCVLNGSWPTAVEQLERALVKAKEIAKTRPAE